MAKANGLTPKQEAFVQELIKNGGNQRRAYMEAYNCENMKPSTIDVKAWELLNDERYGKVAERYSQLREELAKQADAEAVADALEVLKYFTRVMRREETEHIVVTTKQEVTEYKTGPDGKMRKETRKKETPEVVEIPAKLSDANTAAIQLAKNHGLLENRKDTSTDGIIGAIIEAVKNIG